MFLEMFELLIVAALLGLIIFEIKQITKHIKKDKKNEQ